MPDILIYADTVRSPEMRHELPLVVPDPFLYAEVDGSRHVVVASMELPRIAEVDPAAQLHTLEEFGIDELLASGAERHDVELEVTVRACQKLLAAPVAVPADFPVEVADRLRAVGLSVQPDHRLFEDRRRVKNEAELAGIRRAQVAAQAGMQAARDLLRAAEARDGGLIAGAELLTSERLRDAIRDAITRHDATADHFVVAHGAQSAIGHELGSGPIQAGEPIVIDLWPRDNHSGCYADMTRTFVVGEVPAELRRYHELSLEALERSREVIRDGVPGAEVYGRACEPFEANDLPTQRTKQPGTALDRGFFHSLGHGVGLEVHESPLLGRAPDHLVAGDVVAIEPGCYRPGFGGCRLEDLILVTDEGAEVLTDFPYALEP
jgi:Xaa-Pro aminopeptidase